MSGAAERYARAFAIVSEALELADAERAAFVTQACAGDASLETEVLALLAAGEESGRSGAFAEQNLAVVRSSLETAVDGATSDWLPERIGRYTIVRQIGQGGMGIVYAATQESPRRTVALKLLHPIHATPDRLRRFRHETELLGRLQHPGIVQVFDAGTYDVGRGPQPYFAMELVEGVDIRSYCEGQGLDRRTRMELLARLCDAIQYAHEHGVVHRDIKPDNVLVNPRGWPRILDFGVAYATDRSATLSTMLTGEGQLVGTLAYMAPEQLEQTADAVTPRVDVYALGVLGFELLTGRLPREVGDLSVSKAVAVLAGGEPLRAGRLDPSLAGDVETMLGKALESEPSRRYASAAAFSGDLRRHLTHQPIEARPPSRVYLMRKFTRRHRGLVVGALATFLALLAGGTASLLLAHRASEQRDLAVANEQKAVNGLLQSAQVLIDAGHEREAVTQLQLVPDDARGVAWQLLDRAVPFVIDELTRRWLFLDDEHMVGIRDDTAQPFEIEEPNPLILYSLVEHRTLREMFAGMGLAYIEGAARCGQVIVSRAGHAGPAAEFLLLDLEREAVLLRAPRFVARGRISLPEGHELVGRTRDVELLRTPELSQDGRTLLWYTSESEAEVRVQGVVVRAIHDLGVNESVHLGPDGRLLAENRDDAVSVFDLETGALRLRYAFDPAHAASCLPVREGVILRDYPELPLGVSWTGVRAWQRFDLPRGGALIEATDPCGSGFPQAAVFAFGHVFLSYPEDGRFLAIASMNGGTSGAFLVDATTRTPLSFAALRTDPDGLGGYLPFEERAGSLTQVSPSGKRLVVFNPAAPARVIELDPRESEIDFDPRCVTLRGHSDPDGPPGSGWIYHVAVSNDGSLVASSAPMDPLVRVWDTRTGQVVATLERDCDDPRAENPGSWESLMAFSADDERLVLTTPYDGEGPYDGTGLCVVDWNLLTGEVALRGAPLPSDESHLLVLDRFVEALAPAGRARLSQRVQMQGEHALVAFCPPTPGLRNMARPPQGRRWEYVPGVPGKAVGLSVHPRLAQVAVVQQVGLGVRGTGRLKVLDARSGEVLVERELDFAPWCIAYSPDGSTLAIGTLLGHVLLFETERHTQQLAWRAHESGSYPYVYSLAWTPDGTRLVTASGDETVRIWDTRTRVASRLADDRWRALRAEMAARPDLHEALDHLTGDAREAARVELIRRAPSR